MRGRGRLLIAVVLAVFAVGGYFFTTSKSENPITGETQRVSLSPEQEVALGLQAAPQMADQFGGLHPDAAAQATVDRVGERLVRGSIAGSTEYPYEFHLLADESTINAFALPGGQIFLTAGLAQALQSEGELAGVLAHEIGHVAGRHAAERIAKARLIEGLTGAAAVATADPQGGYGQAQVAAVVSQVLQTRYSREDELQSDELGIRFMTEAGYDPRSLIGVMETLARAGGGAQPEFFSTHPHPENRIERIEQIIAATFPDGVPAGLEP